MAVCCKAPKPATTAAATAAVCGCSGRQSYCESYRQRRYHQSASTKISHTRTPMPPMLPSTSPPSPTITSTATTAAKCNIPTTPPTTPGFVRTAIGGCCVVTMPSTLSNIKFKSISGSNQPSLNSNLNLNYIEPMSSWRQSVRWKSSKKKSAKQKSAAMNTAMEKAAVEKAEMEKSPPKDDSLDEKQRETPPEAHRPSHPPTIRGIPPEEEDGEPLPRAVQEQLDVWRYILYTLLLCGTVFGTYLGYSNYRRSKRAAIVSEHKIGTPLLGGEWT
eukprot:Filipodium_phascolosomae@DN7044_c0_g1_i1.p1